jgi:hypothetical protein
MPFMGLVRADGVRHPSGDDPKCFGEFQPRQMNADATVHAAAEVQDGRWDLGVAVG